MQQHLRRRLAAPLALGALLLVPGAASAARVSVRVEGSKRTLVQRDVNLPATPVGAKGKPTCSGTSALGALDAATHGRWSGAFYSSFSDYLISRILGERHPGAPDFWALWVNDKESPTGSCSTRLRRGDRVLYFVQTKGALPLGLRSPQRARAGTSFRVRVVKFSTKGISSPVSGATVRGGGARVRTSARGYARLRAVRTGRVVLRASAPGRIRSESDTVRITPPDRCGAKC